MAYGETIRLVKSLEKSLEPVSIGLVSNICFEPYLMPYLKTNFAQSNLDSTVVNISLEEIQNTENIQKIRGLDIVVLWINYELYFQDVQKQLMTESKGKTEIIDGTVSVIQAMIELVKSACSGLLLVMGLEGYYDLSTVYFGNVITKYDITKEINTILSKNRKDFVFIDLERIIAEVGIENAYYLNNKYRWNNPYSEKLLALVAKEVYRQYLTVLGKTPKCIVLDCDNVLWGGILSEDGVDKINLGTIGQGKIYRDFQRFIVSLYNMGIILAVCSKNAYEDVKAVFDNHSGMVLKSSMISCFRVNWESKVENIIEISNSLNIGLDSLVFVDDSMFEIEAVRCALPKVQTILFNWKTVYKDFKIFHLKDDIQAKDISRRMETYQANVKRNELIRQAVSEDEFLKMLNTNVKISKANEFDYIRIAELSQRTNRCTNGKRYTNNEIKLLGKEESYQLYIVNVSDKFGDLGTVGVMGVRETTLDLFCLSCRALGRKIEDMMLKYLRSKQKISKSFFTSTGKNEQIKIVLEQYINSKM